MEYILRTYPHVIIVIMYFLCVMCFCAACDLVSLESVDVATAGKDSLLNANGYVNGCVCVCACVCGVPALCTLARLL